MKTNFKLKALVVAAIMAVSAPALATMQGATSGNGELLANFISSVNPATTGGDDFSASFDFGVSMNDVLSWNGVSGFTRTWDLVSGSMTGTGITGSVAIGTYGSVWSNMTSSAISPIQFNVIALDNTDKTVAGGDSRYLTTADVATYPSLTNNAQLGFDVMDKYVLANNALGTHASSANGASFGVVGADSYLRSVNGLGQGDTWAAATTADTTKGLDIAQNFWSLISTAPGGTGQATKTPFGFDLNGNGSIGAGEFGEWSVNAQNHTITYANPAAPIPEASTWAMLMAGLGMIGMMVRRRTGV